MGEQRKFPVTRWNLVSQGVTALFWSLGLEEELVLEDLLHLSRGSEPMLYSLVSDTFVLCSYSSSLQLLFCFCRTLLRSS